jgi:arsenite methyltransferase
MTTSEHYGVDAPTVVRNLSLGGLALVVVGAVMGVANIGAPFVPSIITTGFFMAVASLWMLASSLWIKRFVMRRLLQERQWRGDEKVLDVGCGRGLVCIEAARRVVRGQVHGIDLWQAQDLSDNGPDQTLANARIAGVADRVTIDTGDARALPYPDATFDVVTSMTVIHNIPNAQGRKDAIAQMWRVVKPGGQILVFDIRHARTYFAQLRALGAVDARIKGPIVLWGPIGWRFSVRKPAA